MALVICATNIDTQPEEFKELGEIGDGRGAEDLALAILAATEPFGEMRNQLAELADECLFGQLNGFLKAAGHSLIGDMSLRPSAWSSAIHAFG